MTPTFTSDWVTSNTPRWREALALLVGVPGVLMAEIGSYEGRSALWFAEHILTGGGSSIFCFDPWAFAGPEGAAIEARFDANTRELQQARRIVKVKATSSAIERFVASWDAAYIDGAHDAESVFADAARVWPRLAPGGILIFDDYELEGYTVAAGVDSFLKAKDGHFDLLERGWQIIIRKTGEGAPIAPCPVHEALHLGGYVCGVG